MPIRATFFKSYFIPEKFLFNFRDVLLLSFQLKSLMFFVDFSAFCSAGARVSFLGVSAGPGGPFRQPHYRQVQSLSSGHVRFVPTHEAQLQILSNLLWKNSDHSHVTAFKRHVFLTTYFGIWVLRPCFPQSTPACTYRCIMIV